MAVTDSLDKLVNGGFSFAQAQKGGVKEIKGKPLEIPMDHIEPDPDQPRKQFSEASLNEMRDSIKQYGVKTPISVREKPGVPGRYIINFGERRWRGSRLADKRLIPAFIDNEFDPYVAVVENIEREELAPLDLAKWIQGRVDAGDKKGAIAKKLSKDASYVTIHLALLGLPAPIQQLYDKGLCTDARALYDLRKLYEQDAERVSEFCEGRTENVSQIDVRRLSERPAPPPVTDQLPAAVATPVLAPVAAWPMPEPAQPVTSETPAAAPAAPGDDQAEDAQGARDVLDTEQADMVAAGEVVDRPPRAQPLRFMGEWKGRQARLLLEEAPSGKVWLELADDAQRKCVPVKEVKLKGVQR